jgi:anti-sigma factor RsiW
VSCREFDGFVDAYFDGELPLGDALATERHLSECDACRGRYEGLRWLRSELHAAQLDYAPPASLARLARASTRPRVSWRWGAGVAAAAALAAVLVAPRLLAPAVDSEIVDSHLRSLAASSLVDVPSSNRHTVKPWFQGKLRFAPSVPDLSADGFVLVGGRVEVLHGERAAALVYKRGEHVINLFIAEARGAGKAGDSESHGYHVASWTDRGLDYWAISDVERRELDRFARLVNSRGAPE